MKEIKRTISTEALLRKVNNDIDAGKNQLDEINSWRQGILNEYRGMPYGNEQDGRSKFVSTDMADAVEWIMPNLMRIFAGSVDVVQVNPAGAEDVERADKVHRLVNYQLTKKNNWFQLLYTWAKDALRFKTAVVKRTWRYEYEQQVIEYENVTDEEFALLRSDPFIEILEVEEETAVDAEEYPAWVGAGEAPPPFPAPPTIKREVKCRVKNVLFDGPVVENMKPESFYIDPVATSLKDALYCGQIMVLTASEMRQRAQGGFFTKSAVEEAIEKGGGEDNRGSDWTTFKTVRADASGITAEPINNNVDEEGGERDPRERYTVYEHYAKIDVNKDGVVEDWIVWVCNDVVLADRKNEYGEFPFSAMSPILEPHSFYGVSIVELVRDIQKIKTSVTRLMLDNAAFQVNGRYAVLDGQVTISDLVHGNRPGGIVRMRQPGAVMPLAQPSLPNWMFSFMEFIESSKEERTGVTKYNQGLDSSSLNKTATGISTIYSASLQRIELIARVMAETGIMDLVRSLIRYNSKFMSQNVVMRLTNGPMVVSPEDVQGDFDLEVAVGVGNVDQKQKQATLMMGLQATSQLFGPSSLPQAEAILKAWWEAGGFKSSEAFVPSAQEAMGAMNGGPGGGAAQGGPVGAGSEVPNGLSPDAADFNGIAGGLNLRMAQG